ncbi:2-phospho-L-lactate guanylyltransferase [Phenylobacterium sp.]|jgi:2-phospho-L-lactate guanylyltransferase|uniref:2-phospho-L-lactate guanylyltransferase n=1 Tax=Phenylobacterium sp. TaxID=1871053 RepID=UPI002F3EDEC9
MSLRVVIAARGGPAAKSRLAARLAESERAALAEAMLTDMLEALAGCGSVERAYVVTPTPEFARLAADAGAVIVLEHEPRGLNAAFETARQRLAAHNPEGLVALLPGDLPRLDAGEMTEAAKHAADGAIVIVRSQSDGGTGAIIQPVGLALPLAFGSDSFRRHCGGAAGMGLAVASPRLASLSQDLDRPEDLDRLAGSGTKGRAAALARAFLPRRGVAA